MEIISVIMGIISFIIKSNALIALILSVIGIAFGIIGMLMNHEWSEKIIPIIGLIISAITLLTVMFNVISGKQAIEFSGFSTNEENENESGLGLDTFQSLQQSFDNTMYGGDLVDDATGK